MNVKNVAVIVSILNLISAQALSALPFDKQWQNMQHEYIRVCSSLKNQGLEELENIYVHPYWQTTKKDIKTFILGEPERNFLGKWQIGYNMVRRGMGVAQTYEICYLEHCISEQTKNLVSHFQESEFGQLEIDCYQFNCSSNTLGHLFYMAKVLENKRDLPINTIVELGSGYGNLAHIFKTLMPDVTIFLIDLPEILAIQFLFLKASMPDVPIYFHSEAHTTYENKSINLIPVHLFEKLNIKTDLFISTFALSESSEIIQRLVVNNNFFNAQMVYITGQIDGWGNLNFVSHPILMNAVKEHYKNTLCQPMHLILGDRISYEVMGIKN